MSVRVDAGRMEKQDEETTLLSCLSTTYNHICTCLLNKRKEGNRIEPALSAAVSRDEDNFGPPEERQPLDTKKKVKNGNVRPHRSKLHTTLSSIYVAANLESQLAIYIQKESETSAEVREGCVEKDSGSRLEFCSETSQESLHKKMEKKSKEWLPGQKQTRVRVSGDQVTGGAAQEGGQIGLLSLPHPHQGSRLEREKSGAALCNSGWRSLLGVIL